ncbi:MAG TPA: ABC transporter substrate-binding protein [Rectinemataceae bacterium]|nr:ABC transporter substrate-binding protein [Rectinemataceae bacterium]
MLTTPAVRVVSFSPGATEALFAMGAGSGIVATSSDCDYPDEARALKSLTLGADSAELAFDLHDMKSDLLVVEGGLYRSRPLFWNRFQVPVFVWDPQDFVALARAVMNIGILVEKTDAAIKIASTITETVKRTRLVTDSLPSDRRPRVVWLTSNDVPVVYGSKSMAQAMIEAAGGTNVFWEIDEATAVVDWNSIVAGEPQIILVPYSVGELGLDGRMPGEILELQWNFPPNVGFVDAALTTRGSPRATTGLLQIARKLHPESFP